jgi:NAD-dependent SIR2 family protein deacetylase
MPAEHHQTTWCVEKAINFIEFHEESYERDAIMVTGDFTRGEARSLAEECDVLRALGSSLSVEPGASIPKSVARDGTLVIVTDEGTPYDDRAAAAFRMDVTEFLPRLADLIVDRA